MQVTAERGDGRQLKRNNTAGSYRKYLNLPAHTAISKSTVSLTMPTLYHYILPVQLINRFSSPPLHITYTHTRTHTHAHTRTHIHTHINGLLEQDGQGVDPLRVAMGSFQEKLSLAEMRTLLKQFDRLCSDGGLTVRIEVQRYTMLSSYCVTLIREGMIEVQLHALTKDIAM